MKLIHVSAAMSLDGRIDHRGSQRLVLSSQEDLEDVYAARANCDAILIGANTIRRDNPALLFKKQELISARTQRGQPPELIKVTVTQNGNLDPKSDFFRKGEMEKIVICPAENDAMVREKLSSVAKILSIEEINASTIVRSLEAIGIDSLFVEGGTSILTMFLSQGVFHRLRLAIAPFFVADSQAPPFVLETMFQNDNRNRLRIASVRNLNNMAVVDMINDSCNY